MTPAEALAFAQSLDTRFPRWLDVLPPCPCTFTAAMASGNWEYSAAKDLVVIPIYHPGASKTIRSKLAFSSIPGSNHGQQCCYDEPGNLITEGPAAGTPDLYSPATNYSEHQTYDVDTFNLLGWRTYTQYWRPNQGAGAGCAPNAGGGRRLTATHRIVGAFEEIDLIIISIVRRSVTEAENVQVMDTGRRQTGLIGGRGHYSRNEVIPMNDAARRLFGSDQPRFVPDYLLRPIR